MRVLRRRYAIRRIQHRRDAVLGLAMAIGAEEMNVAVHGELQVRMACKGLDSYGRQAFIDSA
jgi:hypothetical protein